MSEITFLASYKPFIIPDEIEEYNKKTNFERIEDLIYLAVFDLKDTGWYEEVGGLFTLPYLYEIRGADNRLFLLYLEKYMEEGDVLELWHLPNQHTSSEYERRLLSAAEPIKINVGSLTYEDQTGVYHLNEKKWVEELSHRNFLTPYGITTIVKY
ncbi:hypothetical protein P8864_18655 [Priestia flexa]|uniref:hypothetical protein n=1 Tax=Priestia flexa TaxID=86664 RepID=UPI000C23422F|nr:hypothetical protein [Priestia flexa]MEC0667878.1 hypothetical protein [Priestia flexa]